MLRQKKSSCFVSKLQRFLDLTEQERAVLADFEKEERMLKADELAYRQGEPATEIYVVKSGWVCTHRYTENGQRQILQLRHPGDLCGLHDLMLNRRSHSLMALEDSIVCPLPLTRLPDLMRAAPRAFLLINALVALDQVLLYDLVQAMSRNSATERVLHFLLHLLYRLRLNNADMHTTFRLPITQRLMGDLLGLTNVTVSKCMTQLEKERIISRGHGTVTIRNLDKALTCIEYNDRYSDLALDWIR